MSHDPPILRRRYRSLWMGEAAASVVFVGLLVRASARPAASFGPDTFVPLDPWR
ncbi:MAG TPA: hypothetical protein VGE07_01940 [Herpetosiphonaceae bacterium]